jgi:biopolymer transport protein ExbD
MTPLIDVVLLLLIFFLLSSSFILQPGLRIELPKNILSQGLRANRLIVTIAMEPERHDSVTGTLLPRKAVFFFNDQIYSYNELDSQLAQLAHGPSGQSLIIKSDQEVPTGTLLDVMRLAMTRGLSVVVATQSSTGTP